MFKCERCDKTVKDNRWAKIHAHDEGWFITKDDSKAYCPDHVPEWVADWRAKRNGSGSVSGGSAVPEG